MMQPYLQGVQENVSPTSVEEYPAAQLVTHYFYKEFQVNVSVHC
jgi:hypothetical protein